MNDVNVIVKAYIQLRDERSELKRKYEEEDIKLKTKMEKLEALMLKKLKEFRVNSFKTDIGTVFQQDETRYYCKDWNAYWQWIMKTGNLDCLEKRVSQHAIRAIAENQGVMPPGISSQTETVVRVRRV
jgi:hypothetical protein